MVWKDSRQSGKFPDTLESFQTVRKVSMRSGKFPDGLKSFQMFWTVSKWNGQFPSGLDSFQMAWNVSRWPGKFPDGLEAFYVLQKLSRFTKTFQVALLPCYLGFSASGPARRKVILLKGHSNCIGEGAGVGLPGVSLTCQMADVSCSTGKSSERKCLIVTLSARVAQLTSLLLPGQPEDAFKIREACTCQNG